MRLPLPPTTNALYRVVNGHPILSREAREWKTEVEWILRTERLTPIYATVSVTARFYLKYDRDVDNLKLLLDVLKGHFYHDDSQVIELHVYKFKDKVDPRVEVEYVTRV